MSSPPWQEPKLFQRYNDVLQTLNLTLIVIVHSIRKRVSTGKAMKKVDFNSTITGQNGSIQYSYLAKYVRTVELLGIAPG